MMKLILMVMVFEIFDISQKPMQDYSFEGADIPLNYLAPLMQLLVTTI